MWWQLLQVLHEPDAAFQNRAESCVRSFVAGRRLAAAGCRGRAANELTEAKAKCSGQRWVVMQYKYFDPKMTLVIVFK